MPSLNIHDLFVIETDNGFPWNDIWAEWIADVVALGPPDGGVKPAVRLVGRYKKDLDHRGMRMVAPHVYATREALFDAKYRVRMEAPTSHEIVLTTDNSGMEWLSWGMQLAFLTAGTTLVHAAAIEHRGKAVIFPSWGGVGKTALVAECVTRHGWRVLGDDLVALAPSGTCYGFPKAMVLYPYHKAMFPEVFAERRGPVAPASMNEWLGSLAYRAKPFLRRIPGLLDLSRRYNPQSVRINPSAVFGTHAIAARSELSAVVWLDRVAGIRAPELQTSVANLETRLMGSTLSQYDPWCVGVSSIAMGLGLLGADNSYGRWLQVLRDGCYGRPAYALYLPADMPLRDAARAMIDVLETVSA